MQILFKKIIIKIHQFIMQLNQKINKLLRNY